MGDLETYSSTVHSSLDADQMTLPLHDLETPLKNVELFISKHQKIVLRKYLKKSLTP